MADYISDNPELEEIVLEFPKAGIVLDTFIEYDFESDLLTPSDGFSFTVASDRLTDEVRTALRPGTEVQLKLRGIVLATGYVDSLEVGATTGNGAEWRLRGRDKLGLAVDCHADPTETLKPKMSLVAALKKLLGPFGWNSDDSFAADGLADREVRQNVQGKRVVVSKAKKPRKRKALSKFELHQLKPYFGEGLFDFAKRIAEHQGLWIWPSADGKQLIVSRPDFDQAAVQKIFRSADGNITNVLDGVVRIDSGDQPTLLMAFGFSGGGDAERSRIQVIVANSAVYTDDTTFLDLKKKYPGARVVITHSFPLPLYTPKNRVLFLHNNDAQTIQQLEYFARKKLAELQRHSFGARYTVEGHGQMVPEGFAVWAIDTVVDVDDRVGYVNEPMYVLGRGFHKSRRGGTTTTLDLIRLNTIDLGGEALEGDAIEGDF